MRQRRVEAQGSDRPALAAWKLPLIVAALAVTIVGGFYLGGPGLGLAVGALAATSIIVMAVRHPPLHPIVPAPLTDFRRHVLVVVSAPLASASSTAGPRTSGAPVSAPSAGSSSASPHWRRPTSQRPLGSAMRT
jgi:hypothetical protein